MMIIVEPLGGLANRLRVLHSALSLAQRGGKNLYVIWLTSPELNCKFSDLFALPPGITKLIELKARKSVCFLLKMIRGCFLCLGRAYFNEPRIENLRNREDPLEILSAYRGIYIRTYTQFSSFSGPLYSFKPKRFLQDIINSYREENTIGVHIRRGDNRESINNSPLEEFIKHMKLEIKKNCNVKFFLATDDSQVEDQFKKIFPSKILTHKKKSLNRNDPLAIQDAVIDLYCLANCSKLIGSYWSSFTDMAYKINEIDRVVIKK